MKPTLKYILAVMLFGGALWGATTTVAQTINGSDGNPANGQALIRISAACTAGPKYVGTRTIAANFLAGAFSQALQPNDACVPANTYYTVSWLTCGPVAGATAQKPCPNGGLTWTEVWSVPTSASPVTVTSVVQSATQATTISPSQIAQSGATVGQGLCWNGTSYWPGNCAGTGEGGAVSVLAPVNANSYNTGFAVVTNGSTAIVGNGTTWTSGMTGRWFSSAPGLCRQVYKFTYVDATDGTLDRPYQCDTSPSRGAVYALTESTYVAGGVGTSKFSVQCYDSQIPATQIQTAQTLVYANYDVEILWFRAASGYCVLAP